MLTIAQFSALTEVEQLEVISLRGGVLLDRDPNTVIYALDDMYVEVVFTDAPLKVGSIKAYVPSLN